MTDERLAGLMLEKEKATPGPWGACGKGKCSCKQVWCPDYPVAQVTAGKWGDEYPAIRATEGSIDRKYEAYMEMIEYGEVPETEAVANIHLIQAAPELRDALAKDRARVRLLEDLLRQANHWIPVDKIEAVPVTGSDKLEYESNPHPLKLAVEEALAAEGEE